MPASAAYDEIGCVVKWLENKGFGDDLANIDEVAEALQEGAAAPGFLDAAVVERLRRYLTAGPNVFARAACNYSAGAIVSVLFGASLEETLVPSALSEAIIEHCSSSNPNQDATSLVSTGCDDFSLAFQKGAPMFSGK